MNISLNNYILYLEEDKNNTKIVYSNNLLEIYYCKVKTIFNKICLDDLTTIDGRIKAIKEIYGYKRNVPIYLNKDIVLFKVKDIQTNSTQYINSIYIKTITKEGNTCKINFMDDTFFFVCLPYEYVYKQYEKTLEIKKKDQNFI